MLTRLFGGVALGAVVFVASSFATGSIKSDYVHHLSLDQANYQRTFSDLMAEAARLDLYGRALLGVIAAFTTVAITEPKKT